jgi:hypothetical protein
MDRDKRKNLIGSMLLYCLAGDLAIRINYGGILISRIENYLIEEVILKDPNHSFLTSIMAAVDQIIDAGIATRKDLTLPLDIRNLKEMIVARVFPIDPSWAQTESLKSLNALADLSGIRIARTHYYASLDSFAQSGKNAPAYAESIKSMDRAMQNIVDICDRYDLAGFGGNEWRNNITVSQSAKEE